MDDDDRDLSRRAQILATEHWSLLASRSTTQSEVLVRIQMFLTLVSAALVSLALVGQATAFRAPFPGIAVGVLAFVVLAGTLTALRVQNVSMEDLMYVVAMNRLRGAYVDLDPGVAPYFMTSVHDDMPGAQHTYYFLGRRTDFVHVAASSHVFLVVVLSALTGLLCAAAVALLGLPVVVAAVGGTGCALAYFGFWYWWGRRQFTSTMTTLVALRPSTG